MPETSLPVEHLFTFTGIAALADQALVFAAVTVVPGIKSSARSTSM